jgi:tRNA U55 pseudouridine synthase TruB
MGDEIPSPTPKKVLVKEIVITDFRQGEKIEPLDLIAYTEAIENTRCQSHLYNHPQGIIPEHLPQIDFRICCGKGTYIRSLARDIGLALDSGAFLASLRREKIGDYSINDAISLESIQDYLAN